MKSAVVIELKYPEDVALKIIVGKRKYDSICKKARAKALPPVVYWKLYEATTDENGDYVV